MKKQKAYREFIEVAQSFLVLTKEWSPKRIAKVRDVFVKADSTIESVIALPLEWEPRLQRLEILARIVLLTKGAVSNDSYAIVKKNLDRATIFTSKQDSITYLRLNNFVIRLV